MSSFFNMLDIALRASQFAQMGDYARALDMIRKL
jgi:hypothetical protein